MRGVLKGFLGKRSAGNSEISVELQKKVSTGHEDLGVMKEPVKAWVPRNSLWQTLKFGEALMTSECLGGRDGARGC